jgi:hypothetical protein
VLSVIASLICVFLFSSSVLALSVGVTPGKMAFSVRPGGTGTNTLQVINQDSQASDFEVYIEGEKAGWFRVTPEKFTLDGQGQEAVEIALAPPLTAAPREYDVTVCVVSLTPGSDLRIGAGIRVPAHVQVTELPIMAFQWWLVAAVILVILIIGAFILWRRRVRYG